MHILAPKNRSFSTSQVAHLRSPKQQKAAPSQQAEDMVLGNSASVSSGSIPPGVPPIHTSTSTASLDSARLEVDRLIHHHVTSTWFLRVCKVLSVATGIGAFVGILANIEFLSVPAPAPDVALALYGILLCVVSILAECEWNRLNSWISLMQTWVGRGLNNILCSILIFMKKHPRRINGVVVDPPDFVLLDFAGYFLLVVGCLYALGGLLCLGRVKERHLTKLRKRDEALMQRRELEIRKQEIENLLRDTESQLERL